MWRFFTGIVVKEIFPKNNKERKEHLTSILQINDRESNRDWSLISELSKNNLQIFIYFNYIIR